MSDLFGIAEHIKKVDDLIQENYKSYLSELAYLIFHSKGTLPYDRHWDELATSTVLKKDTLIYPDSTFPSQLGIEDKSITPNVRSGNLLFTLMQPTTFIEPDSYMDKIGEPPDEYVYDDPAFGVVHEKSKPTGYLEANKLRKFDDIGKLESDMGFIELYIEADISENVK